MAKMPGLSQTIKLDGEAEYRAKLKEIGAGLRVLDSEMDKTKAAFEGQAKSVESLSEQQDVLARKLSTQHDRVEVLREVLAKAAQTWGESDTRTMKWQETLNKAEAEELRLQHQIEGCSAAMREQTGDVKQLGDATEQSARQTTGLGDAVGSAASKLGINLPQGATNTLNSLGSLNAGAAAALGGFAALAAGIVKVEKALISLTKKNAEAADELETLSLKTGLTTQSLQELEYAADFIDVSLDTITGSLTKLTRNMDAAREGTGAAAESFARLGIAVTNSDGSLRSAEEVFYEAIDALGEVQNATERDALAMDLFGRSAQDLNPLIVQGSAALRDLAKEANASGYVLDDFAVKRLTRVDDGFKKLEKSRESFTKKLSVEFAPTTEKVLNQFADLIDKAGDSLVKSGIVESFGTLLQTSMQILSPLASLTTSALPAVSRALQTIEGPLALVANTGMTIFGLVTGDHSLIRTGLGMEGWSPYQDYLNKKKGWEYNSNTGNWYDPKSPSLVDLDYMYDQYVATGGSGSYDYWHDEVWKSSLPASVMPSEAERIDEYKRWLSSELMRGGVVIDNYSDWARRMGYNAAGTDAWRGGLTWVGENGPELLALPRGAQITSASESRELGGDTFYVTINARDVQEFNDIVRIAKEARMKRRKAVSG